MTKRRIGATVLAIWTLASAPISAQDRAADPPRPVVEGDISFSILILEVSAHDLRPYIPSAFRSFGTAGTASILLGAATFTNVTVERESIPDFEWSELLAFPSGDPRDRSPALRGYYVWRLSDRAEAVEGLAAVGLGCTDRSTFICHVPDLSLARSTAGPTARVDAEIPWAFSPYSMSASFGSGDVVPFGVPDDSAWLRGSMGIVREDFHLSEQTSAFGFGTVRTPRGTPLFRILGDRSHASGAAWSWRLHFVATFAVSQSR